MTAEGHRGPQWHVRHIHPLVSPPPPRPVQVPHFPGIGVLISVTESPSGFKGWHRVALHVYEVRAFTCALAGLIDLLVLNVVRCYSPGRFSAGAYACLQSHSPQRPQRPQ
jgi:hypothetical protein